MELATNSGPRWPFGALSRVMHLDDFPLKLSVVSFDNPLARLLLMQLVHVRRQISRQWRCCTRIVEASTLYMYSP
eukprot:33750-Eustigmatos_ZCMA.PRE.1